MSLGSNSILLSLVTYCLVAGLRGRNRIGPRSSVLGPSRCADVSRMSLNQLAPLWWGVSGIFHEPTRCTDGDLHGLRSTAAISVSQWKKIMLAIAVKRGQLSLAIPPWIGATSTSESWDANRHIARCTSPMSVVWQCKLMSGWARLRKRRSAPPYELCGLERTLRVICVMIYDMTWRMICTGKPAGKLSVWSST